MSSAPRIGVVYDCLFPFTTGGGERLYRGVADDLSERGFAVDYLTSVQWSTRAAPAADFAVVPVTGPLSLYSDEGVRRIPAALRFAAGLFRSLLRRRQRYDAVIVSGLPIFNVFAARLALLGSRTRLVVDYLEVWRYGQWVEYSGRLTGSIAWLLQWLALACTPLATCHSQLTASRMRAGGLRTEPLVSPGLIGSAESPEPRPAAEPPYVLYAGRHIPDKRVEALPSAVARAREAIPELRLVVLGSGPSNGDVRAAVLAAGGGEWTDLPGFVDETELDELMGGALCLANPSRREGYGLVVVEASGRGTPAVLVADEGNAAVELVDEGVNGFVAASIAPADVADAIVRVADGGDGLRRSARAWFDEAVQTRTISRTVGGILGALGLPPRTAAREQEGTP